MFCDDHPALEGILDSELAFQPWPETFITRRTVRIPPDTPVGEYEWRIGLYTPSSGERVRARTRLPQRHREVRLPIKVQVDANAY